MAVWQRPGGDVTSLPGLLCAVRPVCKAASGYDTLQYPSPSLVSRHEFGNDEAERRSVPPMTDIPTMLSLSDPSTLTDVPSG